MEPGAHREMLYYAKHSFGRREAEAAAEVIRGGWVSQGPALREFEAALGSWCGAPGCVATSSGTMSLFVALRALGVGPGDEVVVPSLTFLATGSAALLCGARVVLADVGPDLNLTLDEVEGKATERTRAVVPVHFAGFPCRELPEMHAFCRERGIRLLEDAAHALGGMQPDGAGGLAPIGSCATSDAAAFSFHPAKAICTGEGGAVTARDDELLEKLRLFHNHGMVRGGSATDGPWHLEQRLLGTNARLSDILAAIGLVQLDRLPDFLARRRARAERYLRELSDIEGLELPREHREGESAWNLFIVQVTAGSQARDRLAAELAREKVVATVHYTPLHRQPTFEGRGDSFPVTDRIYERSVTLPLYPDLTEDDQGRVISAVRSWAASR